MSELAVPELSLICLVGASGSGKSTFAREHFGSFEILSSDFCRGLVADDENDQSASAAAFDVLQYIAGKRLDGGRLTVVDATNVQPEARRQLVDLARAHDVLPVAIVLDLPERVCLDRNAGRADRDFGDAVVKRQRDQLRRSLRHLTKEGFRRVHILRSEREVAEAVVRREPLLTDFRHEQGPFDVIGDVHGCRAELETLLGELGYQVIPDELGRPVDAVPPGPRKAVFLGDLVDRGPDSPGVLRLVMGMVAAGHALCVPGNHENKLVRALRGNQVQISHGLETTLAQLALETPEFRDRVEQFCYGLVSHLVLDDGRLVVAHAGLKQQYHGRASARVRSFALYGDTTGETDEFGLPVRYPWAQDYRGTAMVLYGHTPTPVPEWVNNTMCLDTGCVFGGALTALRYPEKQIVAVPATQVWHEPVKPFPVPDAPVTTLLEHPTSAFDFYRRGGVTQVICEEKHMGSRAVVLVCRSAQAAATRFRASDGTTGAVYTRTGRSFFAGETTERLLRSLREAIDAANLWAELDTEWLLFDSELLPWSAKAEELLRNQYAAVGAAANAALPAAVAALETAAARGVDVADLLTRTAARARNARAFIESYRRYVWPTDGLEGVTIAPFQLLASDGMTWTDKDHGWHLALADRLVHGSPTLIRSTRRITVETTDPNSVAAGVLWWENLTADGGEGMVVKPFGNLVKTGRSYAQPGVKVRGREYLRIIYGPDYTEPANVERLRDRNLGHKRSLAAREYALGIESLERAVRREPLWRIHEAVFAVLALESEPVDPRL